MSEYNIQQKQFISAYRASHKVPVMLNDDAVVEMIKEEMIKTGKLYPEFASLLDRGRSIKSDRKNSVFEATLAQTNFVPHSVEKTVQYKKTYSPPEKAVARQYIALMLKTKIQEAIFGEAGFNAIANPNKISGSEAWQEFEVIGASIVHNLHLGYIGIKEPLNRKTLENSLNTVYRQIEELEALADNPKAFDKKYKEIMHGKDLDYGAVIDYLKAVEEERSAYMQDKLAALDKLKEPAERFNKTLDIPVVKDFNKWAGRQETGGSLTGLSIDMALAYMSGGMAAVTRTTMVTGKAVTKAVTEQAIKTGIKRETAEIAGQVAGITASQVTGAGLNSAMFQATRVAGALEDGNFTAQEFDELGTSYIGLFKFGYVGSAISGPLGAKFGEWAGRLINNEKTVSVILNSSLKQPTTLGKVLTNLSEHTEIIKKVAKFGTSFVINTGYMAQDEGISFEEALTNLAQMEGVSKMVMAFLGGKTTKFLTPEKVQKITTEIDNCKVEIAVYKGQKAIKVTTPDGKENFFSSHEELLAFVADRIYTEAGVNKEVNVEEKSKAKPETKVETPKTETVRPDVAEIKTVDDFIQYLKENHISFKYIKEGKNLTIRISDDTKPLSKNRYDYYIFENGKLKEKRIKTTEDELGKQNWKHHTGRSRTLNSGINPEPIVEGIEAHKAAKKLRDVSVKETKSPPSSEKTREFLTTQSADEVLSASRTPLEQYKKDGIPLKYTRDEFIKDLQKLLSDLPESESAEIKRKFNIKFVETSYSSLGTELSDIIILPKEPATKAEADIINLVRKFTVENEVQIADKEVKELLESVITEFPEFGLTIGKKQHDTHIYSVDIHTLRNLQDNMSNPLYAKLDADSKLVLKYATILHDIGKRFLGDGKPDKGHATLSTEYAEKILERFDLPDEIKSRIINQVKNHHWFELYNKSDKSDICRDNVRKKFNSKEDFTIAEIMAKSDYMNVSEDFHLEKRRNGIDQSGNFTQNEFENYIETILRKIRKSYNIAKIEQKESYIESNVSTKPQLQEQNSNSQQTSPLNTILSIIGHKKYPKIGLSGRKLIKQSYQVYAEKNNGERFLEDNHYIIKDKSTGKIIRECFFDDNDSNNNIDKFYSYSDDGKSFICFTIGANGKLINIEHNLYDSSANTTIKIEYSIADKIKITKNGEVENLSPTVFVKRFKLNLDYFNSIDRTKINTKNAENNETVNNVTQNHAIIKKIPNINSSKIVLSETDRFVGLYSDGRFNNLDISKYFEGDGIFKLNIEYRKPNGELDSKIIYHDWFYNEEENVLEIREHQTGKSLIRIDNAEEYLDTLAKIQKAQKDGKISDTNFGIYLYESMPIEKLRVILNTLSFFESLPVEEQRILSYLLTKYKAGSKDFMTYDVKKEDGTIVPAKPVYGLINRLDKLMEKWIIQEDVIITRHENDLGFFDSVPLNGTNISIGDFIRSLKEKKPDEIKKIIAENLFLVHERKDFMSTSLNTSTDYFNLKPIELNIKIPKGSKGIYLEDIRDKNRGGYESEILLKNKQGYKILDIRFIDDKVIIDMELIPEEIQNSQ